VAGLCRQETQHHGDKYHTMKLTQSVWNARSISSGTRFTNRIWLSGESCAVCCVYGARVQGAEPTRSDSKSPAFQSPVDALFNLRVGCRLRCQVPISRLDLRPVIRRRITTVISQRRPTYRGNMRRF
jgi:hypothetical protein